MDKNTLLNALIIKKLKEYDSIVESKVNHLEKTVDRVVSSAFDELNAEESLDILVDELEKEYKQKLEITSSELYSLYSKSIAEKVSSIPTPKDGIDGRDGLDGKDGIDGVDGTNGIDGKDYILTEEDKEEIAELVELPDFSKEIDEKINSRTQTIRGGGGGARKLEQLKDVDLSQAQRTPEGKIIIGSSDDSLSWTYLATNWDTAPTLNTTIGTGDVYDYTLDGVTRFRHVPSSYDPAQDSFYETFDGATLSSIIISRT